ncbi:MAG: aspartate aminotransferase family protein [Rhodospirillaceae bacterium]|nr:aspartate aminotransferase family protein [Rhodospirillaceae bacterium]
MTAGGDFDTSTANTPLTQDLIRYGMDLHPTPIISAKGAVLTDVEGHEILDFTSGQMCATIGHNHPRITAAIRKACDDAIHLFSGMISPPVLALAKRLTGMLPGSLGKVMLLNTGAEANEAAIKMAKLHTGGFEITGYAGGWAGMTSGALSVNFAAGRAGYGPMMPGIAALPAPNAYRCPIRHCCGKCDTTCVDAGFDMLDATTTGARAALIAEPVQSVGGILVPPDGYWQKVKAKCADRGMLLIFDEAQTAFGRLGCDFAFQHFGVEPDILSLSKTLGGGLPLSAVATSAEMEADLYEKHFTHVTSHVADPLPAEVGLAVLEVLEEENLNARALEMGERLTAGLKDLQARYEIIGDVRGFGMLQGVELVKDRETKVPDPVLGSAITRRCAEMGLSMNIVTVASLGSVWRIAPPLTITVEELDRGIAILDDAIAAVLAEQTQVKRDAALETA